ncbi:protein of unknown function [Porphyromonadaceae bacterium KH3R12]|uniref:DUF4249 family protein n=1 Tax=Proteiniphilum saccharofermentans TaxID=1642647 RepID=UPI0008947AE8|nr:DUF4249 family protein [Proteiniphilum saccharofermentans]SDZ72793.1 protein of unknown function [Porphyromonadaceae bacterium KH3R12]
MAKSIYTYLSIVLTGTLLSLSACQKEIHLDMANYKPRIVMNGIISSDSLIEISLSKSFLYTDTLLDRSLLKNASITLFINGVERETMRMVRVDTVHGRDRLFGYTALTGIYRSTIRPEIGDKIRIEASAGELQPVWAETTIPDLPQVLRVDTAIFFTSIQIVDKGYGYSNNTAGEPLFRNMRIKMAVSDSPTSSNRYFRLQLRLMAEKIEEYPNLPDRYLYIYTDDDPIFEEGYRNSILEDLVSENSPFNDTQYYNSALFSNKLFRDNGYTLDFSITDYYYIHTIYEEKEDENIWGYPIFVPVKTEIFNPPIEVMFTAISPELHPYFREGDFNPDSDKESLKIISEPEITFSNVHNGIGVVGSVSTAKAYINIPPLEERESTIP